MAFSLKDYEIIGEIGRGGFGAVYRARQKSLDRIVAIKRLDPGRTQDRGDIARFRREARAMAALAHDNIITVYDYAFQGGNYYIVMEYVDGLTLEEASNRKLRSYPVLFVLERVLRALAFAHAENIIHRDIKPSNVLLGKQGQVKLADFGLASIRRSSSHRTSIGGAVGTICYMAPEAMVAPEETDARVDTFSFGCMAYEALTGRLPFPGDSIGEVSYAILNKDPEPMELPGRLPGVETTIGACLSKDREQRPALREVLEGFVRAVGDRHHTAQEEVVAFVRGRKPILRDSDSQPAPPPAARLSRRAKWRIVAAGAAVAVAALAVSIGIATRPRTLNLPSMPLTDQSPSRPASARSSRPPRGRRDDGPAPLVSSDPHVKTGTLRIRGVTEEDTVLVNGIPAPANQHGARVPVSPGHCEVDVRLKDGTVHKRTVEIMPYQVHVWNVSEEEKHREP